MQCAHWAKDSVTIYPCIAFYKCPEDDQVTDEYIDIISDDLGHDSHAVHAFMTKVIKHLKEERKVDFQHAIIISDGCAAQYKSKIPFMDVRCSIEDHGITVERYFNESRHGKNSCDGEAGVLKSHATCTVKNGKAVITDAESFYNILKENLEKPAKTEQGCNHKRCVILYVWGEINRVRPEREVRTITRTQKLHSVMSVLRGAIQTRQLSCFCEEYIHTYIHMYIYIYSGA